VFNHQWFKSSLTLQKNCVKDYFSLGHMVAPNTVFKNIYQVKPGETITIKTNGTITTYCSSSLFNKAAAQDATEIRHLYHTLSNTVKDQMISDVPLGTFLSGGIDSPVITAMSHRQNKTIEAFTLAVEDKNLDESFQAKSYANHLNCKQQIVKIEKNDILNVVDTHFDVLSQPFGDYSSIPTFLISKLAKKDNTVMLSGDGGDELFFGYPRILKIFKLRHWFKIPMTIRKPLVRLFIKIGVLKSWAPFAFKTIGEYALHGQSYISNNTMKQIMPNTPYSDRVHQLFQFNNHSPDKALLQKLRYSEFYCHLQRVLTKVDLMSMGNSLEIRVPFLDKRIINQALTWLPKSYNQESDLKLPLKEIMCEIYPKSVINTKKKGFAVPINDWLKGPLKHEVEDVIFKTPFFGESCFDIEALKRYVSDFFEGKHNEAWGIWHVYTWQKWAIKQKLV